MTDFKNIQEQRLLSGDTVFASRYFAYLQGVYRSGQRLQAIQSLCDGWDNVSPATADALLSGVLPHRIEGDAVVFEVTEANNLALATLPMAVN